MLLPILWLICMNPVLNHGWIVMKFPYNWWRVHQGRVETWMAGNHLQLVIRPCLAALSLTHLRWRWYRGVTLPMMGQDGIFCSNF